MANFKFSVGTLTLKQSSTVKKAITVAKDITIDYKINTHKEYGAEGQVVSEEVETEDFTCTCDFIEDSFDTSLDIGAYYDIYLGLGGKDGSTGLALTLANCRITGYNVKTSQGEFKTSTLTFSKKGKLTDAAGATVAQQTVTFGTANTAIGDSASVDVSYDGNVQEFIIPTALGIGLMSTSYLGGGKLNITVKGYVKKNTKIEIEQYLINLYTTLQTTPGDLIATYRGSHYHITNCCFVRGSAGSGGAKYVNMTLEFIKSAY